jgi:hypothetical protein
VGYAVAVNLQQIDPVPVQMLQTALEGTEYVVPGTKPAFGRQKEVVRINALQCRAKKTFALSISISGCCIKVVDAKGERSFDCFGDFFHVVRTGGS